MHAGRRNRLGLAIAGFGAGLLASGAALSDAPALDTETVSQAVSVRGLDLSSPAGAEQAYRQIAAAARQICWGHRGTEKGVTPAKRQQEYAQRCFDDALSAALAQVAEKTGVDLVRVAALNRTEAAGVAAR